MLLLLTTLVLSAPAVAPADSTRTMNGVTVPVAIEVAGHRLTLNGMALRKKVIFKVYVATLYVATPSHDAAAILAEDAPRRMEMHFIRNVDKGKICDAWNEGLDRNTPNPSAELRQDFVQLCDYMGDIKDGQSFVFTYVPGEGTKVVVAGTDKGTIQGKEFADAILNTWIGPDPGPGDGFKKKILGES